MGRKNKQQQHHHHTSDGDLDFEQDKIAIFSGRMDKAKDDGKRAVTSFGGKVRFICAGCGYCHGFTADEAGWNHSFSAPTTARVITCELPNNGKCVWSLEDGYIAFDKRSTHEMSGLKIKMNKF
jgi:hypothetical protein